jgi:Lipoprotein LpqB beta-propeller domain/Sporulation and spore germination
MGQERARRAPALARRVAPMAERSEGGWFRRRRRPGRRLAGRRLAGCCLAGRRPVGSRPVGRGLAGWLALAGAVVLTLCAGCADVPASGLLQSTSQPRSVGGAQPNNDCCGLIYNGPQADWKPVQLVRNFILASADFADNRAVAREYLTRSASANWQPGPGPAVTVVAQAPSAVVTPGPFGSSGVAVVRISAQVLGQVTATGQYIPEPGGQAQQEQEFTLQLVRRQWRIARLPTVGRATVSHELMLTKDLFQLTYQPRNLYYLDPNGKHLVPDPVFVPVDTTTLSTDLVNALRASPQGWLADGVLSAFPPAAQLLRPVVVPPGSKTAIVNLGLPRADTTSSSLAQISAQLVWTLTSPGARSAAIQAVKLYVNGRPWTPPGAGSAVQDRGDYPQPALDPPAGQSLYFLTTGGAARVRQGPGGSAVAVPGQAGSGRIALSSIAVSPDVRYLAAVSGSGVYTENLAAAARQHASPVAGALVPQLSGVNVTAMSWDNGDNLWIAGRLGDRNRIWTLSASGGPAVPVPLPAGVTKVSALRVAPDGVRVAMIAATRSGSQVLLAAIVRTDSGDHGAAQVVLSTAIQVGADLPAPKALSWYDADHLLVVNSVGAGMAVEEVPVDGDRSSYQGIEPAATSIAAAGPRNDVYAGLETGYLARTVGLVELWSQIGAGRSPVFPG